ncbi:MAG: [Fe-Fe] hydrogenase large subunit C-terminal domain-containing protein [Clostridia bacterium]
MNIFHSVTLDKDRCKGCINCMKRCPTEAIRVRNGKATIISERCIDCGECIRVCQNRAKKAVTDSLSMLENFKYNVALPAPSFYGQFNNLGDINYILTGLLDCGFDMVYEVSTAAEIISDITRRLINNDDTLKKPVISSACPAVLRLIRVRFPELCNNVLPIMAPVDLAAKNAREQAIAKTHLKSEEIGVFFISPCPAKVTAIHSPIGITDKNIDGAIAVSEVYKKILSPMKNIETPKPLSNSGIVGISWGSTGGESSALLKERYLAADGIENVITVLEEMEDEKLNNLDFIELNACPGGCVGGVLNMENPFVAKARIQRLRKYLPLSCNKFEGTDYSETSWTTPLTYTPILKLSDSLSEAMQLESEIEKLTESLPGLDCGSCGAPSCRAFAEDVTRGLANINDCVISINEEIQRKLKETGDFEESYIPAPFRK